MATSYNKMDYLLSTSVLVSLVYVYVCVYYFFSFFFYKVIATYYTTKEQVH